MNMVGLYSGGGLIPGGWARELYSEVYSILLSNVFKIYPNLKYILKFFKKKKIINKKK